MFDSVRNGAQPTNSQFPPETEKTTVDDSETLTPYSTSRNSLSPISRRYKFTVARSPSEDFPYTNCLGVHRADFPRELIHVLVDNKFSLTIRYDTSNDSELEPGFVGVSLAQRQWMGISEGARVSVVKLPHPPHIDAPLPVRELTIELDFLKRGYQSAHPYRADEMIMKFKNEYEGILVTDHEPILFKYQGEKLKGKVLSLVVGPAGSPPFSTGTTGFLTPTTQITFVNAQDSAISIIPSTAQDRSLASSPTQAFTAEYLGIGGLDHEFDTIRRVLASYELTGFTMDQLGVRHIRGIILYGPSGTGKSFLASQIGKVLDAREPRIVNGYDLADKSTSMARDIIRTLFLEAEKEYETRRRKSRLHIIVIDQLDAIPKRPCSTGKGGEGDSVVTQILSKMDNLGPNVLLIGTANDLGAIDRALLQPARFEVHVEIPLPNEAGRYQILNIQTSHMRPNEIIDAGVDLREIARLTRNFSGAEIGALIRCATSFAFNRYLKVKTPDGPPPRIWVRREDFVRALSEIRPAFGVSAELQNAVQNDIIPYDHVVDDTLKSAKLVVEQVRTSNWTTYSSILLYGPPGSGKTALAASIARNSGYPFIRLISPDKMVGYSETEKIAEIAKSFADSQSSELSVIVVDDIERLIDWSPKSDTYSNAVLQAMLVLFRRRPLTGRRLLVIATSCTMILRELGFAKTFSSELFIPLISSVAPVEKVLGVMALFPSDQEKQRAINMIEKRKVFPKSRIGIKELLDVVEMARQEKNNIAERLVTSLLKWKESEK